MRRLAGIAFLTLGFGAGAQDVKPTVAPAPIELRRVPTAIDAAGKDRLRTEYERLVRAAGVRVPTPSEMTAALEQLKRMDFAASDEALAQLAHRAQALYGVHVQLDFPVTGTIVGVGKVVRSDGKRVGDEVRVEQSREMRTYPEAAAETVRLVLERLQLGKLPASLPVIAAAPLPAADAGVVEPPPSPPPLVVETAGPSRGRITAYAIGGAGLIAAAIGAGLLVSASQDASALNVSSGIVGVPYTEEAAARARSANSASRLGAGLLGASAALVAAAAVVFFISPDTDAGGPKLGLGVTPNGGFVQVSGELP